MATIDQHTDVDIVPPLHAADPSVAGQLGSINTTLAFLVRDIRKMQDDRGGFEQRTDERVGRIEDAVKTLTEWRQSILEASTARKGKRWGLLLVSVGGGAAGLLTGLGWVIGKLSEHIWWHP